MTLVSDIVRSGMRESNIVARQQTSPPDETNEALARLETLVFAVLGSDVGYILEDWTIKSSTVIIKPSGVPLTAAQAAAYTVAPNSRLVCGLTAATSLSLNPMPQDGEQFGLVDATSAFVGNNLTLVPNGRKINGTNGSLVLNTAGVAKSYFYRADIADWRPIAPLVLTDQFIFPEDFDDFFITSLAMRMNPRYGKQLSPESKAVMDAQKAQITARYSQTRLNISAIQTAPPVGGQQ